MPRYLRTTAAAIVATAIVASTWLAPNVRAWDSEANNPTHPTHSYLTEWAIDRLKSSYPELNTFRLSLLRGANCELHELPTRDYEKKLSKSYAIDLEAARIRHGGTNEGCSDIQGWWNDSVAAYRAGKKELAYLLLGVMLHHIEDMGVPAHANKVVHQGNVKEFDNFEFLALSNWRPKFDDINRRDPGYAEPWKYYEFSRDWTHADSPGYHDRNAFSKFWASASKSERALLSNRQGRTSHVVLWTLTSASKALTGR